MASKDLFAPPTEAELQDDMFAPPSEQELASEEQAPIIDEPKMSAADAAGLGSLQGLTFGFADELKAGIEAPFSDKDYEHIRDEERALYAAAEKQHPGTFLASDIGSGLLTGGTLVKGVKAGVSSIPKLKGLYDKYLGLSKAKQAATAAAGAGALEGLGRTEEETVSGMAQDVATTGGLSALFGGAAGKISDNLSQKTLAKKAMEKAKDANIQAMQSIGATASDIGDEIGAKTSKRASMESAKGTGTALLEEDLLKTMDKPEETVRKINEKLDDVYNTKLAKHASEIDKELTGNPEIVTRATDDFLNNSINTINEFEQAARYSLKDGPALSEGAGNVMKNILNDLRTAPNDKKLSTAVSVRQKIRDMTNFNKSDIPQAQQFYKELYGNLNKYIDNLSSQANPKSSQLFQEGNQLYGRLSDAREIAVNNMTKTLADTKPFSAGDLSGPALLSTAVGATAGIPAGAVTLGGFAAKKAIESSAGKPITQIYKTYRAQKNLQSAKGLMDRALNYGGRDKFINELTPEVLGGTTATSTGSLFDQNKIKQDTLRKYAEKASPEELHTEAQNLVDKHGKGAQKLSNEISNMADKDIQGRRAAMFSIMQDPGNRQMLMNEESEDEVDNVDVDEDGEY